MSETSLTSSGAPSTEDSSLYVQGPVFGRRAERMMKASSIEWSDNSEDEHTVSVKFRNTFFISQRFIIMYYQFKFQDGSHSIDMSDVAKNLPVSSNK